MTTNSDDVSETPSEKLAALVARKKAASAGGASKGVPGQRQSERAAGALAASKSRPAPRKS